MVDRWLNADGVIGASGTVLGYNLFTYCNNNPVMYSDPHGDVPGALSAAFLLLLFKYGSAFIGALLALDLAAAIEDDLPEVRRGKGKIIPFRPTDPEQSPEPAPPPVVPFVSPTSPPDQKTQAIFPENPYDFKPKGLILQTISGSYNGRIFKWNDPVNGVTIFEWNEDFRIGPHYHALLVEWDGDHLGPHYRPGTPVPEPWNTIYFGG